MASWSLVWCLNESVQSSLSPNSKPPSEYCKPLTLLLVYFVLAATFAGLTGVCEPANADLFLQILAPYFTSTSKPCHSVKYGINSCPNSLAPYNTYFVLVCRKIPISISISCPNSCWPCTCTPAICAFDWIDCCISQLINTYCNFFFSNCRICLKQHESQWYSIVLDLDLAGRWVYQLFKGGDSVCLSQSFFKALPPLPHIFRKKNTCMYPNCISMFIYFA